MAIELIGMTGGHPEHPNPNFINPAVMAVVNNPNLERIVAQGLMVSDKGEIPITDVNQLIQLSSDVRSARKTDTGEFREIVVYLGIQRNDTNQVGALPFVGGEKVFPYLLLVKQMQYLPI